MLVGLYEEPEKPANALEFVHQHMSPDAAGTSDVEALKKENAALKAQVEEVSACVAWRLARFPG